MVYSQKASNFFKTWGLKYKNITFLNEGFSKTHHFYYFTFFESFPKQKCKEKFNYECYFKIILT